MIGSISNKAVLHRPAATRIGGRGAQGMSMIEVLVSVMVLGVGLLGIAAMQSIALRGGQGSLEQPGSDGNQFHHRSDARQSRQCCGLCV